MISTPCLFIRNSALPLVAGLALLSFNGASGAAVTDAQLKSGQAKQLDGRLTAQTTTTLEEPIAAGAGVISVRGRTGTNKGLKGLTIYLLGPDGKAGRGFGLSAGDLKIWNGDIFADAYIEMPNPLRYFVRPNMKFYKPNLRDKMAKTWDKLPAASAHDFTVEFRRAADGTLQLWFDGNFMDNLDAAYAPDVITGVRVVMAPGASVEEIGATKTTASDALTLPVAAHARPAAMAAASVKLDADAQLPAGLNLNGRAPNIAVGNLAQFSDITVDDLQSYFWRRTAADNLPEQRMFSVPLATYSHANILCAVENDPKKVDAFTLRVARYGRSQGNALADTIVRVPAATSPDTAAARRVGTVSYGPDNARKNATLWLLKVPIKNGLIQDTLYNDTRKDDILGTHKYLDVELMDPLPNVEKAGVFPPSLERSERGYIPTSPDYKSYDFYGSHPAPQTSGVHVFGLQLQKSPAQMEVRSNIGIQAFYASDKPVFDAKIVADKAGDYTLSWEYADVDGKIVETGKKQVSLQAGAQTTVAAPVATSTGWFAARLRLSDADEELIDYRTSFVMLPPDTRKAGLESPFYGAAFLNHGSDDLTLDDVGPLFQRLGIRRIGLGSSMPESETLPKYGFTKSTIPWTRPGSGKQAMQEFADGKKTLAQALAMQENYIREQLKLWPSIDRLLVFHESGAKGAPFPSELWGVPATDYTVNPDEITPETLLRPGGVAVPKTDKSREIWEQNWPKRLEYLRAMAPMVHQKFPQLKLQYGNDGNSMGILGELFRQKFPREYIDTIASEDLGQTFTPESTTLGGTQDGWFVRELARKTGYGDVPITATTEWIGRMTEDLGNRKQAEWKARDGLLALAYGYDTINLAGLNDASDGYYYSIWANGGVTERSPILAPKPSFASLATLTRVLDRAKFQRFVPTGSMVTYVEEFRRGDDWVYAVWTPRGTRAVTLRFPNAATRTLTDLYGRDSQTNGATVNLTASTSVQYLVSSTKLDGNTLGVAAFPRDKANVPANPMQTILLESTDQISIVSDKGDEEKTAKAGLGKLVEGQFYIRQVDDAEMGRCIEIELKPGQQFRLGETPYVKLNLAKAVTTKAKNAGVWIKGNGGWGDVNITKNHWGPWADNGNRYMRWPNTAALNFEGWNFIKYPYYDWVHDYGSTEVKGLHIEFPTQMLVGTEMEPVKNQKVRIKSIVLF